MTKIFNLIGLQARSLEARRQNLCDRIVCMSDEKLGDRCLTIRF